ncbi:MAG: DUF2059 domain-containing protein [Gammaproteobacteria bacterium]|nr:DUF2059 domain-containing protein [Gammaproteobacteria bacterium]
MIIRILFLTAFLTSCAATNNINNSENLDHRALAEELIELTNGGGAGEQLSRDIMRTAMEPILIDLEANGVEGSKIDQVSLAIDEFIENFISDPSLNSQIVDLYIGEFTAYEIKQLLDFYKRPIGKKALEKLPVLFQKGADIGVVLAEKHQGKFAAKLEQILASDDCPKCSNEG